MESLTSPLSEVVSRAIQTVDFERTQSLYWEQNECAFLDQFLSPEAVAHHLLPEVEQLRVEVHRSYIPKHKKGGSVSYYTLAAKAPVFLDLYHSPAFIDFISRLVGTTVMPCPNDDPHACALYFYTEPGDHIGFHYDTSCYKGARYTILMGLVQHSAHCRLICQLYKGDSTRGMQELRLAPPLAPWWFSMAISCGMPSLRSKRERSALSSRWSMSRTQKWAPSIGLSRI